ncbi:MAG: PA2779 family protein [Ramlibacter sp.]|nr:PA2779 family protein [Ramlibacter sp.]
MPRPDRLPDVLTFQTASAGMIRTEQAAAAISPDRALVLSTLTRSDVSEQMQAQGLDPAIAAERVAAMTDAEVRTLADNINTAPAGGLSTLAAVVIIGLLVAGHLVSPLNLGLLALQGLRALQATAGLLAPTGPDWRPGPAARRWSPRPSGCAAAGLLKCRASQSWTRCLFFAQSDYQCGPAALATVLHASGAGRPDAPGPAGLPALAPGQPAGGDAGRAAPARPRGLAAAAALRRPAARAGRWPPPCWCCRTWACRPLPAGTTPWWWASTTRPAALLRSGTTRARWCLSPIFELTWRRSGYWAMVVSQARHPARHRHRSQLPARAAGV